jgi:carboxylate-amine ligase
MSGMIRRIYPHLRIRHALWRPCRDPHATTAGTDNASDAELEQTARMRTVGVEEELLLVNADDGSTIPVASRAIEAERAGRPWADERVDAELQEQQIETNSRPHRELADLRQDLRELRARADRMAQAFGARAVALATAPTATTPLTVPKERYQRMARVFGQIEHEQLTCGCHVHVEVASPDEGVVVLDRIRSWLPVVAALSVNSPFWSGHDTGYASYRQQLWARWPTAGPVETLGSHAAYLRLVESMLASGAAMDQGMVYFDARLSAHYPTVEVRIADVCLHVDDAVTIAGLCRALVEAAATQWRGRAADTTPVTLLRSAAWRASRYGVGDRLVHPLKGALAPAEDVAWALFEQVGPALEAAGDTERVRGGLERILSEGTGADLQRAVVDDAGGDVGALAAVAARVTVA